MEIAQNNAEIIIVIGIHAVCHLIKNGMKFHVLLLGHIELVDRTDSFIEDGIEKTVLQFNGKTAVENVVNAAATETVQDFAVFGKRQSCVSVFVSGNTADHGIRYRTGAH